MCGIAGIFLIDEELGPSLGELLTIMLGTSKRQGPDSAGIAIYSEGVAGTIKITVQSDNPDLDFSKLAENIKINTGKNVILI